MVIFYPIGVPLLFAYLLFSKKERINKPVEVREKDEELFGMEFLFDNYKPKFWYFEIVVTVLRLLLTGVLGLIKPGSSTQMSVGMLMALFAIMIICCSFPYENRRDNVLSILSYVQVSKKRSNQRNIIYHDKEVDDRGCGVETDTFFQLINYFRSF